MSNKYYKIVSDIKENFDASAIVPMYDESPDLAVYESARPSPSIGDYIILGKDFVNVALREDFYGDAEYGALDSYKKAKAFIKRNRNKLQEVPKKIFEVDFDIREKIRKTDYRIYEWKEYIIDIQQQKPMQKLLSGNREIKSAKAELSKEEAELRLLTSEYERLMEEGRRYNKLKLHNEKER